MQAVERARRHLLVLAHDGDRAGRARRDQLDDPEVLAGAVVDEQLEPDLIDVESLGAIDVR